MLTDLEKLEQDNTILRARVQWYTNVTQKLLVMVKNAADVFQAYEENVDQLRVELNKTKQIYSKLHTDLQEALNEQHTSSNTGLHQSDS